MMRYFLLNLNPRPLSSFHTNTVSYSQFQRYSQNRNNSINKSINNSINKSINNSLYEKIFKYNEYEKKYRFTTNPFFSGKFTRIFDPENFSYDFYEDLVLKDLISNLKENLATLFSLKEREEDYKDISLSSYHTYISDIYIKETYLNLEKWLEMTEYQIYKNKEIENLLEEKIKEILRREISDKTKEFIEGQVLCFHKTKSLIKIIKRI